MEQQNTPRILLRYADLKTLGVLYSLSTIWRLIAAGQFPAPIKLGAATVAFFQDEVLEWVASRQRVVYAPSPNPRSRGRPPKPRTTEQSPTNAARRG
jgi:predicted DNA-binding transcriptional regulator AlpA